MSAPTISPRRHLMQALTLVHDVMSRRRRDGLVLSDEENDLLQKIYMTAPRTTPAAAATAASAGTEAGRGGSNDGARSGSQPPLTPTSPAERATKQLIPTLTAGAGGDDVSNLVNFAVSCSALTQAPVQLMQLLVDFVLKHVPEGKPVSMMIFDGEFVVDALNCTLLANADRYINLFSGSGNNASDFVFDAAAAAYFLPVAAEGELFGFVQINNMHRDGDLPADKSKVLIAATCTAALALRTSWQLEDLEWSHRKQVLLLKVANSLTSEAFAKEADVTARIVARAKDIGDAQSAFFFRVDDDTRAVKYFLKGDLLSEEQVFAANRGSEISGIEEDEDEDDSDSITDAVRIAMQTAEHVVKTQNVVQLKQAAGDEDTYVDVSGARSQRYGGAARNAGGTAMVPGAASPASGPSEAATATATAVSIRRRAGSTVVNLPFSLAQARSVRSVMGVPIMSDTGKVKAVVVLTNKNHRRVARIDVPQVFEQRDSEMMLALSGLGSIALTNCRTAWRLKEEKKRRDATLSVVAHLNEVDIRNSTEICKYVMHGARKLLNADRSTLFLIDEEHDELYSAVADSVGKTIRFPVGKGIAGRVALTGQPESIRDAYQDDRFNKEVDKETGYRTLSILTVPVQSKGNTVAVAQLINKLDPKSTTPVAFEHDDLEILRTFSMFAGIAISNSQLLEFTVKAGREAVALTNFESQQDPNQTLQLQRSATQTSMQMASNLQTIPASDIQFVRDAVVAIKKIAQENGERFDPTSKNFDLFALREEADDGAMARDYASAVVVVLFEKLGFGRVFKFDEDTLIGFILQCRKQYRYVPYHNFFHAVDVTRTLYSFLYNGGAREFISELDAFVLLATGLVHDLDHAGLNNNFHLKCESPLGILSSVSGNNSVLEVHHCNIAIQILSTADAAIFGGLSRAEQSNAYRIMMSAVLATDMARHATILQQFDELCTAGYNKEDEAHRLIAVQVLIKSADISNITQNFEVSRQWATAVTEEFYQQGDKERARGMAVLPMNDRQLGTELAKGQLGFIGFVGEKFFTTLQSKLFTGMQYLVDRMHNNKAQWQKVLEQNKEAEAAAAAATAAK